MPLNEGALVRVSTEDTEHSLPHPGLFTIFNVGLHLGRFVEATEPIPKPAPLDPELLYRLVWDWDTEESFRPLPGGGDSDPG